MAHRSLATWSGLCLPHWRQSALRCSLAPVDQRRLDHVQSSLSTIMKGALSSVRGITRASLCGLVADLAIASLADKGKVSLASSKMVPSLATRVTLAPTTERAEFSGPQPPSERVRTVLPLLSGEHPIRDCRTMFGADAYIQ